MENVQFDYNGYSIFHNCEYAVYITARYYNGMKNNFKGNATGTLVENGWEFVESPDWVPPHFDKTKNIAVLRSKDGETYWYFKRA